jgi:hypothetical protein
MNKLSILILLAGLLLLSWSGIAFYFSGVNYATRIIGVSPTKNSACDISAIKVGLNGRLVRWFMSKDDFEEYKQNLFAEGFQEWTEIHYDASDPTTFADKVVLAGFPKGSDATAAVSEKIQRPGKSSIHLFYDYPTGEFVAIKAFGTSRISRD